MGSSGLPPHVQEQIDAVNRATSGGITDEPLANAQEFVNNQARDSFLAPFAPAKGYAGALADGKKGATAKELIGNARGDVARGRLEDAIKDVADSIPREKNVVDRLVDRLKDFFNPPPIDPIIIDLDGDGIELVSLDDSVARFDLDGDGFREQTGWVAADDALLAIDRNGNGSIDGIEELFGSVDAFGYQELAALDQNQDGVIDTNDAEFSDLVLWQDLNGDGISDEGEIVSVKSAGIASFDLNTIQESYEVAGNEIVQSATTTFVDGRITQSVEVLFELDQARTSFTIPSDFEFDDDAHTIPILQGFGEFADLRVATSLDDDLKQTTTSLIATLRSGDLDQFDVGFENFLFEWAGVRDAVWLDDAPDVTVYFLEDANEVTQGFFFVEGALASFESLPGWEEYLTANQLSVVRSSGEFLTTSEFARAWLQFGDRVPGFTTGTSSGPGSIPLPSDQEEPLGFGVSAQEFAFLQKLSGDQFDNDANYLASGNLLPFSLDETEADEAQGFFNEIRDYYKSRFYVEAAYNIALTEGSDADYGFLAPFLNLYYNVFDDEIDGDWQSFTVELIEMFRSEGYGTDADALGFLSIFLTDASFLPSVVTSNFPEIEASDISRIFDVAIDSVGTQVSDDIVGAGVLNGYLGNDTVAGSAGEDVLSGDEGDDLLSGAGGSDVYLYRLGDGNDTIDEGRNFGTSDSLIFLNLQSTDVEFENNGEGDLLIHLPDQSTVTVNSQFSNSEFEGLEDIRFTNINLNTQLIRNKTVEDMKSSGLVFGSAFSEFYYHTLGDGSYTITDSTAASVDDRLVFTDVNADDVTFSQNAGQDLVITLSNGETITVTDHFRGALDDLELIEFADGTVLNGQAIRDKSVADQKASGVVLGSGRVENYVHTLGDGSYTITDATASPVDDRLIFTDVNVDDVTFTQNAGQDLVITLSNGETITVTDHFRGALDDLELIEFADGTVLNGQAIRDKSVADQKASGVVLGSGRVENYVHTLGDGSYTITDATASPVDDRLIFTDVNVDDVTFTQNAGQDLVITLSNGETITVTDHFRGALDDLELIEFADGTVLNGQAIRDKSVADQKTSGVVLGSGRVENYVHTLGDGSYTITDATASPVDDRLIFTDVNVDDVTFTQNAGQDLVITLSNGETVTVTDHFRGAVDDLELIEFANGTVLNGQAIRDKSVADQKASGVVLGSGGAETYVHTLGDGSYTITDSTASPVNDRLIFTDVNVDDVTFTQNAGQDLVITLSNGETVTVTDHFRGAVDDLELIEFANGTVLNGQAIRDKSVADQKASGVVLGSGGAETYVHRLGDGSYTITDSTASPVNDRLIFTDVNVDDVTFTQNAGQDLVITLSNGETVTVTDHFRGAVDDLELIEFANGTVLNGQAIRDKSVADQKASGVVLGSGGAETYVHTLGDGSYTITDSTASPVNDRLIFTDVNVDDVTFTQNAGQDLVITLSNGETVTVTDHFRGAVDDLELIEFANGTVLNGQAIRDKSVADQKASGVVLGSGGAETYVHTLGDGSYTITDSTAAAVNDRLIFTDVNADDVTFTQNAGQDLVITLSNGETITVIDHFRGALDDLELIEFADGTVFTLADTRAKTFEGGSGADQLNGTAGNDRIFGGAGSDTLLGGQGNDTLNGDDGDDRIDGGNGDDDHFGGAGDDYIFGSVGDDYFDGGEGNDTLDFSYFAGNFEINLSQSQVTFESGFVEQLSSIENVVGGSGQNSLIGSDESNEINGASGHDTLSGGGGADTLIGGEGNDTLRGDDGNDRIDGGNGDDDHFGGAGDDYIFGSVGDDYFDGGEGNDTLDFSYFAGNFEINLSQSQVTFESGFIEQLSSIENVVGGSGQNSLIGSDESNEINGASGHDTLTGGLGDDTFVFGESFGNDVISDFEIDADQIKIEIENTDLEDLVISTSAGGAQVSIEGHGTILLLGVEASSLQDDVFVF